MIKRYDSLDIELEDGKFFLQDDFYSSLKDKSTTHEEYEHVKMFYQLMKLKISLSVIIKSIIFETL